MRPSPSPDEEIRDDEECESSSGDERRGKVKKRHKKKKEDEEIRGDEGRRSSSGDERRGRVKKRYTMKKKREQSDSSPFESSGETDTSIGIQAPLRRLILMIEDVAAIATAIILTGKAIDMDINVDGIVPLLHQIDQIPCTEYRGEMDVLQLPQM